MNIDEKSPSAFLTIGEVSAKFGIPQHILRFWETRFPQLRPLKRSGNRRYYRPEDVRLVGTINDLLHSQGYTIAGARKLVSEQARGKAVAPPAEYEPETRAPDAPASAATSASPMSPVESRFDRAALQAIRDLLADALQRSKAA